MNTSLSIFHNLSNKFRYIEFSLKYRGSISRSDLMEKFSISEASATRAIREYINNSIEKSFSKKPNAIFNKTSKTNEISNSFTSLYNFSEDEIFYWLQLENSPSNQTLINTFNKLNLPYEDAFSPIVRCIMKEKCARIKYLSLSSGEKERIVIPHSLFNDGLRLYIRVYDRNREKFLDLASARIVEASELDEKAKNHEMPDKDHDWNDLIELALVSHPRLKPEAQKVVKFEYKMIRDRLKIMTRKSMVNYFLRVWNIDCSKDSSLNPKVYHLKLENIEAISNILTPIAPGVERVNE